MIPTVDFYSCGLLASEKHRVTQADIEKTTTQLIHALRSVGFCYLVNHGISDSLASMLLIKTFSDSCFAKYQDKKERKAIFVFNDYTSFHNNLSYEVNDVFKVSRLFFEQTSDVKQKYARPADSNHGWTGLEREKLNPERPAGDLKESFNCQSTDSGVWPLEEVPNMKIQFSQFFNDCTILVDRILEVLAIGLKLEDRNFFKKCHSQVGKHDGSSTLRSLFYPCLSSDGLMKPGQVRCGEHSDYGTLTLLFQDDIGGLQILNTTGVYVDAKPVSGTIVINVGDLLQRWTSNTLKATKHRVLIPDQEAKKRQCRQSIAFFLHPDDDFVVKCLDGSDTYEPITNKEYLNYKFSLTY